MACNSDPSKRTASGTAWAGIWLVLGTVAVPAEAANVTLAWNKATDARVTGYEIAYGLTSGSANSLVDAGNSGSYTVAGLQEGKTYFFRVRGYNNGKSQLSAFSNEVSKSLAQATPVPTTPPSTEIGSVTVYGAGGGAPFVDQVSQNQRLTGLVLRAGWTIDAIQEVLDTGALPQRGSNGGTVYNIKFESDEYLVAIYGKYNKTLSQLTFFTNKNHSFGPYGRALDPDGAPATADFRISAGTGKELVGFSGRVTNYLQALGATEREARSGSVPPVATPTPQPVATPVPTTPPTSGTSLSSSVYGANDGITFSDQAETGQRLTGMLLRSGWWLDGLQLMVNGTAKPVRGGNGGNSNMFTLASDDYLVSMSGKYGNYVSQLTFRSKLGKTFGPYGDGRNTDGSNSTNTFGFTVPEGSEIVGLTGRASSYLHAVGALYRTRSASTTPDGTAGAPKTPTSGSTGTPIPGLVAAYNFDETGGTTVMDRSGFGNHGVMNNSTRLASGRFGRAVAFSGASDSYVTINHTPSLGLTTGMTLEAWVYRTTNNPGWGAVVSKEQPDGVAYYLYANSSYSNRPVTGIRTDGYYELPGQQAIPTGQWVHLAGTYDGNTQRLYVNGMLVSSESRSGSIQASDGFLRIGGNWGGEAFTGYIDDLRVYNRALLPEELAADMVRPVE